MRVGRLVTLVTPDSDIFAVPSLPRNEFDLAIAAGKDVRALGGGIVDAFVELADMQDRMYPPAESVAWTAGTGFF